MASGDKTPLVTLIRIFRGNEMKQFHYMQAYIDDDFTDGTIRFISYNSAILDILGDTLTFYRHWNYSRTTIRQLSRFLKEHLPKNVYVSDLRECKKVYEKTGKAMLLGYNVIFTDYQPLYY